MAVGIPNAGTQQSQEQVEEQERKQTQAEFWLAKQLVLEQEYAELQSAAQREESLLRNAQTQYEDARVVYQQAESMYNQAMVQAAGAGVDQTSSALRRTEQDLAETQLELFTARARREAIEGHFIMTAERVEVAIKGDALLGQLAEIQAIRHRTRDQVATQYMPGHAHSQQMNGSLEGLQQLAELQLRIEERRVAVARQNGQALLDRLREEMVLLDIEIQVELARSAYLESKSEASTDLHMEIQTHVGEAERRLKEHRSRYDSSLQEYEGRQATMTDMRAHMDMLRIRLEQLQAERQLRDK